MNAELVKFRVAVLYADLKTLESMVITDQLMNSLVVTYKTIRMTALSYSAAASTREPHHDHVGVAKFLLNVQGIDVNVVDTKGRAALHWASLNHKTELVQELVKMPNIKFEMKDHYGSTAQDLANAEIACVILTARLKKSEKSKDDNVNVDEVIGKLKNCGKRKLKLTLKTFESRKKMKQEELVKLDTVIEGVKKCINDVDPSETLKDAKKDFECPICMEVMDLEIWQCDEGHPLCGDCKSHYKNCSTCAKAITSRSRAMENLYVTLF